MISESPRKTWMLGGKTGTWDLSGMLSHVLKEGLKLSHNIFTESMGQFYSKMKLGCGPNTITDPSCTTAVHTEFIFACVKLPPFILMPCKLIATKEIIMVVLNPTSSDCYHILKGQ